jgi:YD repeat-containing protein
VFTEMWFYYDGYTSNANYGKVGAGNVTRVVSRLGSNPADYPETWMTYDSYGNITTVTDALGRVTLTECDAEALYPRDQYNALGHKTTTVMDYRWGKPAVVIDPNGRATTYAYDSAGRLQCVTRPLSQTPCSTQYTYTYAAAPGELSRIDVDQEEANHASGYLRTTEYFDALGRHRETRTFRVVNGSGQTVVANKVTYDRAGRVLVRYEPYVESAGPAGATLYFYRLNGGDFFDPLGRVHRTLAPNATSRYRFYQGSIHTEIDEAGVERRRQLDPYGRVVREEIWRPGDTAAYAYTDFTYDGAGRLLTTKQNNNSNTTIANTYDQLGRKTQMVDTSLILVEVSAPTTPSLRPARPAATAETRSGLRESRCPSSLPGY